MDVQRLNRVFVILAALALVSCSSLKNAGEDVRGYVEQQIKISTELEWRGHQKSISGLSVREGFLSGEGMYSSSIIRFDTPRNLQSLTVAQSKDWNGWVALPEKIVPPNLVDAPVFLPVGDGDYWLFGRRDPNLPFGETVSSGTGGEYGSRRGYHAWHSQDMIHWVHHGPVTDDRSRWVTSIEHVDGEFYIFYDYPNDQDPHLIVDRNLRDGLVGEDVGLIWKDPSDGSDAGVLRDLDGRFHLFYEDYSPINASEHSWDSPLAGRATSADPRRAFRFSNYVVDHRTTPTGEFAEYEHPHWLQHPDWTSNIARYEVHTPKQDAFGDWTAIRVGDEYYLFGDYDPAEAQEIESDVRGAQMKIARFRSKDLGQTFEFVGSFGRGHPDPTIGFAEGRFFLITQTGQDYSSFGPWVRGVSARVRSDMDLSRFRSDLEFQLSCLSFECQGAFPSKC